MIARGIDRAVRLVEDRPGLGQPGEIGLAQVDVVGEAGRAIEALLGQLDRRLEQPCEGQLAEPGMRILDRAHEAADERGATGGFARPHHVGHAVAGGVERPRDRHRIVLTEDRVPAGVERARLAGRRIMMHQLEDTEETDHRAAAQHDLGQRRGQRGVHRRTALAQRLQPRPGRKPVERRRYRSAMPPRGRIARQRRLLDRPPAFPIVLRPARRRKRVRSRHRAQLRPAGIWFWNHSSSRAV
jgi:hypothetical protein